MVVGDCGKAWFMASILLVGEDGLPLVGRDRGGPVLWR